MAFTRMWIAIGQIQRSAAAHSVDSDRTAERSYFAAVDSVYTLRYRRPWEGVRLRFAMKILGQAMDHRARRPVLNRTLLRRPGCASPQVVRCPQTIDLKPGSVLPEEEGN